MPLLLRSEEIKSFFFGGKFHGMLFQLFSFLNYAVKYMWARLYKKAYILIQCHIMLFPFEVCPRIPGLFTYI